MANYAARKALGMDIYALQEHHITDEALRKAAGWEEVVDVVSRQSLAWLGHVARMPIERRPKQALFGWTGPSKQYGAGILQTCWLERVLKRERVPLIDWFRLAQDRKPWKKRCSRKVPALTSEQAAALDAWAPGAALPVGPDRRGPEGQVEGTGHPGFCIVCNKAIPHANMLPIHYATEHGVADPDIVTKEFPHQCRHCFLFVSSREKLHDHDCPALRWQLEHVIRADAASSRVRHGPAIPPPEAWQACTDGSGQTVERAGGVERIAGWGVA
eukprot:302643-Pyramimonas_sp.AAC.1